MDEATITGTSQQCSGVRARYVGMCSQLGLAGAGDSPSDALVNLKEATQLYLENVVLIEDLISINAFLQVCS